MIERAKSDFEIEYYMETSAKTGLNATEIFLLAAKLTYEEQIREQQGLNRKTLESDLLSGNTSLLNKIPKKEKNNCAC